MPAWKLHPALVHFPIALLLSAIALDVVAIVRGRPHPVLVAGGALGGHLVFREGAGVEAAAEGTGCSHEH